MVGPSIGIGARPHRVILQAPGPAVPDPRGGYTQTWTDLVPRRWQVAIETASVQKLERLAAGSVIASAEHIVTGPYRADITTTMRLIHNGRTLNVLGVFNPEERNIDTVLACAEIVE